MQVSKRDYLRDKVLSNNIMESVYHSDGRIVKSGSTWKYEILDQGSVFSQAKGMMGNVRVTFADDNGNGILLGYEIRSIIASCS